MTLTFKCRLLDLSFVTALLLAAAVPLVFLRGNPWPFQIQGAAGLAAILTGIVAVWVVCARRRQSRMPALENGESGAPSKGDRLGWQRTILVAALLGGLTLVNFYSPLQLHFWEGADEFLNFQNRSPSRWMHEWDVGMNRPFTVLPCVIGQTLTPGRVDGFLWLSVALCWVNGLLLFAIVRELLPKAHILPVAAAVLLVIDRSDPTRFFVMWIGNYYWMALAFLLAGSWLFLRSYRLGSRSLLALSCASLGGALLINEASYPLAVLVPVLAWFKREYRHRLAVWTYAWAGMLIVFATRFLLFMNQRGADAYQASQLTGVIQSPRLLLTSLRLHLQAGLTNFQLCEAAMWGHKTVVAALVLAALLGFVAWRVAAVPTRRRYLAALGIAGVGLLLGILPFLPFPHVFRTQFFAAPGLAVFLASALCLLGSFLGRRAGGVIVASAISVLAANATGAALAEQKRARASSPISFEGTVHIFRQIHGISPNLSRDTFIVLVPDDPKASPLRCNYACLDLSHEILGANMVLAGVRDGLLAPPVFGADSVAIGDPKSPGPHAEGAYNQLLVFRVATDGTVTLLRRLPTCMIPSAKALTQYDPLARLRPGPVGELAYLRYPRWAKRPRDLFDMVDGVLLGDGWGPLERHSGDLFRQAADSAELLVNPLGQSRRELTLLVDAGAAVRLEAVSEEGKVLGSVPLAGRQEVSLAIPTDPARVSLVRLRAVGVSGTVSTFQVYYRGADNRTRKSL